MPFNEKKIQWLHDKVVFVEFDFSIAARWGACGLFERKKVRIANPNFRESEQKIELKFERKSYEQKIYNDPPSY